VVEDKKKIRTLLIDDHTIFRQGLIKLLSSERDLDAQLHCGSVGEGLLLLGARGADVVLLDVDLGTERGIDFLVRARRKGYQGPVLILTAGVSKEEEELLRSQGISGVLRKDVSMEDLAAAIRAAAAVHGPHDFIDIPAQESADRHRALTTKEKQVLRLVVEGHTNKEIAGELQSSEAAVKGILQQLFHKSGTTTRTQLVRLVLEQYRDQM
jgi:DNA-binding NarL/FixJ family response regulator